MKRHYIAMAGLNGYMPQFCEAFPDRNQAVDTLAEIHEIGKNRTTKLRKYGYIQLNLRRDGNEYCEIQECTCNDPSVHCESGEYSEG